MGNEGTIRQIVLEAFGEFKRDLLDRYRIGGRDDRKEGLKLESTLHCFNPLLQTEADIQMYFGGILSKYVLPLNLFVHAEMPIYASTRKRCDLTIHRSSPNGFVENDAMRKNTLICAIEIKYANYVAPNYDFQPNKLAAELGKLREHSGNKVVRFLLIVDEANAISDERIKSILEEAKTVGVDILSNNPKFG